MKALSLSAAAAFTTGEVCILEDFRRKREIGEEVGGGEVEDGEVVEVVASTTCARVDSFMMS